MIKILFVPAGGIIIRGYKHQLDTNTLARCKMAAKLWYTKKYHYLILLGGIFIKNQKISASQLMSSWLITGAGIPQQNILIENQSLDTYQNVRFFMQMMKRRKQNISKTEISCISQPKHLLRIQTTFQTYGIKIKKIPVYYPPEPRLEYLLAFMHLFDPLGKGLFARINQKLRQQS